jgi:hypothetical protein
MTSFSEEFYKELKIILYNLKTESKYENKNYTYSYSLLQTLNKSSFFMKQYIKQEFKTVSRFIQKKYYNFRGYPVKINTDSSKKLVFNFKVKKENKEENFNLDRLKSTEIEINELRFFTLGSKTRTQFESWTPMEMFIWWKKLRESNIPKNKWKIIDAVFFLFINQLSQIINIYMLNFKLNFYLFFDEKTPINKYKIDRYQNKDDINDPYLKSLFYFEKYLEGLDNFYSTGGEYGLLLEVQSLYYEYYEFELYLNQIRHSNNNIFFPDKKVRLLKKENSNFYLEQLFKEQENNINEYQLKNIGYTGKFNNTTKKFIRELESFQKNDMYNLELIFNKTLQENNYSLIIFQSFVQSYGKYISLYSIPIIPIFGLEQDEHNGGVYTPLDHVHHDLFHSSDYIYFLENILYNNEFNKKSNEDIQEFYKRTLFLQKLYEECLKSPKNKLQKSICRDSQKLLWWMLHEKKFDISREGATRGTTYKNNPNINFFFNIDKLKEILEIMKEEVNKNGSIFHMVSNKNHMKNIIDKLIEICVFVLDIKINKINQNDNNKQSKIQNNNNLLNVSIVNKESKKNNFSIAELYICSIENFAEIRINSYYQIFFGFDSKLFLQLPNSNSSIFFYKYAYFGNNIFRKLVKDEKNGFYDIEIKISDLPLYDLLCLMEFAKLNNINALLFLIINELNSREITQKFRISQSDHLFLKIKNSNYNKKTMVNIGKTKKSYLRKTFYFFGKYGYSNFKYACYSLNNNVFYYEINEIEKEKSLDNLEDREALEELKSFIILRSLKMNNSEFGNIIYQKANEIILKLKLNEILFSIINK